MSELKIAELEDIFHLARGSLVAKDRFFKFEETCTMIDTEKKLEIQVIVYGLTDVFLIGLRNQED